MVYAKQEGSLQTHRRQTDWDRRKEWDDNRERKNKIIVFIQCK
jgi:hypothetical protein